MQFKEEIEISEIANNARFALDLLRLRQFSEEAFRKSGYTLEEVMAGLSLGETLLNGMLDTLKKLTGRNGEPNNYFLGVVEKLKEERRATYRQLLKEIERGISDLETVQGDPSKVSEIQTVYELLNDICLVMSRSSLRTSERLRRGLLNVPNP
ncbi:MAG: hypothetical protein ACTSP1_11455 [Candidatus Freyarchaeota archaeon]